MFGYLGLILNTLGGVVYTYVKYMEKGRRASKHEVNGNRKFSLDETNKKLDHVVYVALLTSSCRKPS